MNKRDTNLESEAKKMAISNHERVGKALELFNQGLMPFFERELIARCGDNWQEELRSGMDDRLFDNSRQGELIHWDTHRLLSVMWNKWNEVFGRKLGHAERSLVSELREVRNRWAHQKSFTLDDAYRALDSISRLLTAISAPEAEEVERLKQQVLRQRFEEQTRRETKRATEISLEGKPAGGLKPWREIITPHPDVASGRYQQAEFAADLGQVFRGEGADEYRDPREFFRRTYLTEGLRHLLTGALQRLAGRGGDPVIELQTNFGGGKTHSMLAMFHLFSNSAPGELAGMETVLRDADVNEIPQTARAVLVGTALSPGQPRRKADGTVVHTMWGELAYQLGKREGYALLAEADERGVSPGSDVLRDLFDRTGACLILIDEWIAFVRQLYGVEHLPAGSFDANLSFAQALTEAARQSPNTLVVASIPSSDIEIGGEGGKAALERLKNTFGRLESAWRPASAEEGFEIVRRRLFQPITNPADFTARDAVVRAYAEMYRTQASEFPSSTRESDYERRLTAAYPIHPELFDRLYNDWSSLDKFQRTRGVLRLMAAVIHTLWERQDGNLLIMPASVPVDAQSVQFELTRYMEDSWIPVIEKDVDGATSLPLALDRNNPNFGRYSACRRVARTLYLGSAPTLNTSNRGLEDNRIKLGCVQPGESVATFGDALRRMTDQATHLYVDGTRYWFSTQPSVTRLAQDRAAQFSEDVVIEEIRRRLRADDITKARGDFLKVHPCPASSSDVPDERDARLVILDPEYPHNARATDSPARKQAQLTLDTRSTSPRTYRNALVFLAADRTRLEELNSAVRQYLAWKSIDNERQTLNLDAFQTNQAQSKCKDSEDTIKRRIPETYQWLIVPIQPQPQGTATWEEFRLQGEDALAVRASKKLKNEELLITLYAPTLLRSMQLDAIPLWRGDHVGVKQLCDDFAQYLYLPRLQSCEVLLATISAGLALLTWEDETFAYAEGYDEARNLYRGLSAGASNRRVVLDNNSLVVKSEASIRQIREQSPKTPVTVPGEGQTSTLLTDDSGNVTSSQGTSLQDQGGSSATATPTANPPKARRFHGVVDLDANRLGRDAGTIAEAIVQHIAGLIGSEVEISLEIHAEIPDGAPDNVVRTVTENCRTLRFKDFGFEES